MAGLTDVAQTIEQRLGEIEAQLRSYEELARERERLQRALHELRVDDGAAPRRASATPAAASRTSAPRGGGRRARRGSNVEAITGFVTAHPGATAAEIATGTGIGRGVVYSATSRLAGSGRLRRVSSGDRQVGYELGSDDAGGAAVRDPEPTAPAALERPATRPRTPTGSRTGAQGGRRAAAGRRRAGARGRAPRGANRAAVLAVIGERPGVSARELAAASGVSRGTLYALLRTLTEHGEVAAQPLPSGHTGYTLAATPTAPSSGAPDTPRDSVPVPSPRPREDDQDETPSAGTGSARAEAAADEQRPEGAAETEQKPGS